MTNHACANLQIAICDDESADRAQIEKMSREILCEEGSGAEISCFDSAGALLESVRAGRSFHILLLDVMMEGMDGMELAAALRAGKDATAIIFISSNRDMALRGYEVSAARYLAKPVDRAKLREGLLFCRDAQEKRRALVLPTASGQSCFNPADIAYVEAWDRGVRLHIGADRVEARIPISQIADMLPKGRFVYCHRTLLVNLGDVRHVRYCELELISGERLPISKYRFAEFKRAFLQYLKEYQLF